MNARGKINKEVISAFLDKKIEKNDRNHLYIFSCEIRKEKYIKHYIIK